jgi:FMN phosphatase YigB (HAD superfamily)
VQIGDGRRESSLAHDAARHVNPARSQVGGRDFPWTGEPHAASIEGANKGKPRPRSLAAHSSYRALSLDFWFTAIYYSSGTDTRWREDRIRVLRTILTSQNGEVLPPERIEAAMQSVETELRQQGREPITVAPEALLISYAERLDARLAIPSAAAANALSSAGLEAHPPSVNAELNRVMGALNSRNVPIIAITNTARSAVSWHEFFRSRTDAPFRHIVTSCEVGRAKPALEIFQEASERLGLRPDEILHVGDRWELDVVGARRAGFGAALYRGLWAQYPKGLYPDHRSVLQDDPDVLNIEHLDDLLEGHLLRASPTPTRS